MGCWCPESVAHSLFYAWRHHSKPFGLGGTVKLLRTKGDNLTESLSQWMTTLFVEQTLALPWASPGSANNLCNSYVGWWSLTSCKLSRPWQYLLHLLSLSPSPYGWLLIGSWDTAVGRVCREGVGEGGLGAGERGLRRGIQIFRHN